ncbi:peptide synthetase [Vitiosangium sp. GDMCC 1.1324]|nr:peptide synthetase [Vitiosangium sp. GDMCC 1.1324]
MLAEQSTRILLADSRVQDVQVVGEGRSAVAWVVPRRAVGAEVLDSLLQERLGSEAPRVALIDVIPFTASGSPDIEALSRLTPVSPSLLQELEARLLREGREAVALRGPRPRTEVFAPLDELLPEPLLPKESAVADAPVRASSANSAGSGRPALVDGGPRRSPPGEPSVLGDVLRFAAERQPERTVTFIDTEGRREAVRYADLWAEVLQLLGGLEALGLGAGQRVMLLLEQPGEYIRAFWACLLGGLVPVPMPWTPSFERSHPGVARILSTSERLGGPLVLTDSRAASALQAHGLRTAAFQSLDRTRQGHPVTLTPEAPALLSFTSGSTGRPKGVVLAHQNLLAMCDAVIVGGWYTAEDTGLSWMPLDHVAGVAFAHITSVRTRTSHTLVARDYVLADVLRWLDLLSELRATQSWAPNFAYGLVAERLERGERHAWDLSRLRVLVCAGEPLVVDTLQRFLVPLAREGLRQDVICPMWGMAETSSAFFATRGVRTLAGDPFVVLGPPVAGAAMRIVDEQDAVVQEGTIGHLQVRGASVMSGYLDDAALNAQSFTPEGWFRTGDLAIVRDGEMAIAGRQKEVLIINGANVYPQEIEAAVEQVPGVLPSFAVASPTRAAGARTDELVVFFVPSPEAPPLAELLRSIREHVGRTLGLQIAHLIPVSEHQVPKTGLGKRGRTEMRGRFESGELSAERREAERALGGPSTLPPCLAVPRWVPRPQLTGAEAVPSGPLLLIAGEGFAESFRSHAAGRRVVRVAPGPGEAVARALEAEGARVEDIVYVVGRTEGSSALARGALAEVVAPLLALVRALAPHAATAPLRLRVVVPLSESVQAAGVASLMAPGLLWSAMAETPGLEARIVWVPPVEELAARFVAEELQGLRPTREVLWREGQRSERVFTPWVPSRPGSNPRLKREGLYLVTGALGGVGQLWARYLRRSLGARLVLVGRRERDAVAEALERELGAAEYVQVDVTDVARLQQVLRGAEARHGRAFDGAFHFANTLESAPLGRQTAEELVGSAAAQVLGAVALAESFRERPEVVLVFASSLMGTLGAGLHAGYCAASGFVDRFAQALAAEGRRAVAVSFSSIRATGMARGLKASPPGYRMLEPSQALATLVLAVESGESHVLAGVEGSAPPWRSVGLGEGAPLEQAHLFVAQGDGPPLPGLPAAVLHRVPSLPRGPDGKVDREALAARASGGSGDAPTGPLEEVIVEAFRDVLGVDAVGRETDFFSLGGSSLQATRVMARINERTGLRLREVALFEHPSVSRLADHLRRSVDLSQLDVSQLTDAQVDLLLHALHTP